MYVGNSLATFLVASVIATFVTVTTSEIFTSSLKVERMVMEEEHVLQEFKRYIDSQYERLKAFSSFYADRLRDVRLRQGSELNLKHPNAVYHVIKQYADDYANMLGEDYELFRESVTISQEKFLADSSDVHGSRLSLLRLQNVYNLNAMDMAKGDYLGYMGPQMDSLDAFEIGQTAFTEGKLNESLEWLNVSLALFANSGTQSTAVSDPHPTIGAIKALIGRAYLFNGSPHLAEAMYREAKRLDPTAGDVIELEKELLTQPRVQPNPGYDYFQNFSRLCSLENKLHPADPNNPRMVCRYRKAVVPYYLFKEEIVSISPFATVIYDVITDTEGDHMKELVKNKLARGQVGGDNSEVSDIRTSDIGWIYEGDSQLTTSVAKRIECITGLDNAERLPDGPSSGEAFQVVNYGLGGHYEVHMDPFDSPPKLKELKFSGERIATFLIYLNDVERGGSTVFTRIGLSVPPTKNMALFWYNFNPAHQKDELTNHAGCPVLIGHKWIVNKWIWTYGNTFRRRCGLTPEATQLDIDADMASGYK